MEKSRWVTRISEKKYRPLELYKIYRCNGQILVFLRDVIR